MSNTALNNLGNTCYMAAIVQLLAPRITDAMSTVNAASPVVARRLAELFNVMSSTEDGTALSPHDMVDTIHNAASQWVQPPYNAKRGQQHCAEEFLQYLLVAVPELDRCVSFSERTFPATRWLAGSKKLSVDLVDQLGRATPLSALIHAQYAGGDGDHPVEIGQLRDALIVHIKRWRNQNGLISKDNTEFSISEPLDIYDRNNVCIGRYALCGYVDHLGRSTRSGHYTATSKRTMADGTQTWLCFDDGKQPAPRDEASVFSQGGRSAYILLFTRIGDGGHTMPADLVQQVADTKEAMRQAEVDDAWESASPEIIRQAHELMKSFNLQALRTQLDAEGFAAMRKICVAQIASRMSCPIPTADRAVQVAMDNSPVFQTPTPTAIVPFEELPLINELPMWSARAQWRINPGILKIHQGEKLVYGLVREIVGKHEIYRDLLSVRLDNTDITVFIERPEQSGKTFTCTLMAWLSNICLGQAAYVLLRSGGQASEDYGKYGESVDALNRMIWQVMLGYTFDGPNGTGPYRKVNEWYDRRLLRADLLTESAMVGFMNPFVLHSYDLRHDKTLSSSDARQVLSGRWPIVFSRLCTPSNLQRSIVHEMDTIIQAYGVDEHGFANITLLNDEYQQNVKEGTRVQEEMHVPLASSDTLFRVCAGAIRAENPRMSESEALAEMDLRFAKWQAEGDGYAPPSPGGQGGGARFEAARAEFEGLQATGAAGTPLLDADANVDMPMREYMRWDRSAFSACIKSLVRISATIVSGQVSSEDWDLRKGEVIELKVGPDYCGHKTSAGIDPNQVLRVEWRGSSNLEFLEEGDYPTLLSPPPRLQKFVMDEVFAEFAREGYAHILLQSLGLNNGALFDIARFLISYADETVEQLATSRPVIAITAYMRTTAGSYPGGPWLVFSQDALPLRNVIADVAQRLFVDADPKSHALEQTGKIVMRKGAEIAPGIRTLLHKHAPDASLNNALQLPTHSALFLKNLLALVDGAIESLGWRKSNIKIVTVGANLLKVGMTPKTPNHRMSVTLGLLSASGRQLGNLTGEDVSQGLHGRTSGSRDPLQDPYWAERGDDLPPRLVASGYIKDMLSTYKKVQQFSKAAAKDRADGQSLVNAMNDLDFHGFSDLPRSTKLWHGLTPGLRKRRGEDARVEETIDAIRDNSTGVGAWKQSRSEGYLDAGAETHEMLAKFNEMQDEHPGLFETSYPQHKMPGWGSKIWMKWRPDFPHYLATVIDAEIISEGTEDARLKYRIRFDTDERGNKLEENDESLERVMDPVFLDPDMTEWSYEEP